MGTNGKAYTLVGVGVLFAWSGIKGWSILQTIQDIVQGHPPTQTNVHPIVSTGPISTSGNSQTVPGATVTNNAVADDAQLYKGHIYKFGGAPGRDGKNPWDCSSFVNWVVGRDLGMPIPGYAAGKYDGSVHGPPTTSWGVWSGLSHIKRADVQAGDIIVWALHMGIAISNKQMISATGPDGTPSTVVGDIDSGGNGPILAYGRLTALTPLGQTPGSKLPGFSLGSNSLGMP